VGRALFARFPDEWATEEAAYKAFTRAKNTAKGGFVDGRWAVPA
jgi:hypothetical protein